LNILAKLWYHQPIYEMLIEILQKKQGSITDVDIYDMLKQRHNDLSFITFNKTLMKLEIRGIVHVYNLTKNKRGVELLKSYF
jgi:Fe2+ or Zn2+ uptake regulation protein